MFGHNQYELTANVSPPQPPEQVEGALDLGNIAATSQQQEKQEQEVLQEKNHEYEPQTKPNITQAYQGYPGQGYHGHGYPGQGYPPQGYPPQGYPPQGYPPQGYPGQGYPGPGYPPQGYPGQGYPGQGYPPQGYPGQNFPGQPNPTPGLGKMACCAACMACLTCLLCSCCQFGGTADGEYPEENPSYTNVTMTPPGQGSGPGMESEAISSVVPPGGGSNFGPSNNTPDDD